MIRSRLARLMKTLSITTSLALALAPGLAQAWSFSNWLSSLKRTPGAVERADAAASKAIHTIHLGEFTGGTGKSARGALMQELVNAREFAVVQTEPEADFIVTGSSVGGRVTGSLRNRAGKQLFERTYAAPGLDENLKALADDLIYTLTGKPGVATSRIVFVSDRTGSKQIYLCDANGQDVQQVTRDPHAAVAPSLSPDSSMVAFTSYRNGFPVVQVVDLGAGWERTITDTPGSSFGPAFSPDGARLAVVMSFLGTPEIFVTNLNTNTASCISDTVGVPASPSWHPNGRLIMFSDDRGEGSRLFVAEIPGANVKEARLFRWRTSYHHCTDPEWSPDGSSVAFTVQRAGQSAVVIKAYPEGEVRVVQGGGARHPSWSPNGRFLTYAQQGNLFVHDLNTNQRRAIVTGYGAISEPRWMR